MRPDTAAHVARTSVSVAPEISNGPLVVTADACAYALDRSMVSSGPSRWERETGMVHSTTCSNATPDPK